MAKQERILDAIIIGAGPSGLATAEAFRRAGLDFVVLEKGPVGGNIAQYPTYMKFFSTSQNLELCGFPLVSEDEKPTRAEYLAYLAAFARYHQLPIRSHTEVLRADRRGDGLHVLHARRVGCAEESWLTRTLVAAPGAWDNTRRLVVPGEDLPKVHRRYTEAHLYDGARVLVVGGSNSAVETALQLHRRGADVTLCHRGRNLHSRGLKYWLRPDIENRIAAGEIRALFNANVQKIDAQSVTVLVGEEIVEVGNDFVLPLIGYNPPTQFLRDLGIEIDAESGRPVHDPDTLETSTPGVYVAGVITAGNINGQTFIENLRHHGDLIAAHLSKKRAQRAG